VGLGGGQSRPRYTFGDDDPAGQRLQLVAEAYRPTSESFVTRHAPRSVASALDLGCGPGFSTQLLARLCRPRQLLGIDASPSFVELARQRVPDAEFAVHDTTVTPLPGAPATMIYARLLLAHLADPLAVARRWQGELSVDGKLLIEDLEDVTAPAGPLRDYEAWSTDMVRSGGGSMYAGRALAGLGGSCVDVKVPARLAATISLFNVERWSAEEPEGRRRGRLDELARGLAKVAAAGSGTVAWTVRQIALSIE
jgi:trans-aconitate 2-methyltransferase